MSLDSPCDPVEAHFPAFVLVAPHLRIGRRAHRHLVRLDAVENGVPCGFGQVLPGHIEREIDRHREAVHHPAVPRVRVVLERFTYKAAAADAPLRVRDQQLRVRELVHAQAAACPARALWVVEHEVRGPDVPVHEMVCRAAHALIETRRLRLARTFDDVQLDQAVTDEQRVGDSRLDRLLVLAADDEPVHHGVHVLDGRFVEADLRRDVHGLSIDDQPAAAFLANVGQDEIQLLTVDLEDRGAERDLSAFRERQDRFEDLAGRPAGSRFARSWTVRLSNRGIEEVQVAGDVGHRADGRARVAGERLLFDRNDRRQPEHEVHVRFRHVRDESLGVGRKRLHVAALSLRVNRVEGQARLARSGETGDHDQAVARNLERDVLQVVHARTLHGDGRARGGLLFVHRHCGFSIFVLRDLRGFVAFVLIFVASWLHFGSRIAWARKARCKRRPVPAPRRCSFSSGAPASTPCQSTLDPRGTRRQW